MIELNEAFAAQGLAVLRELGLSDDDARGNPNAAQTRLAAFLGSIHTFGGQRSPFLSR